MIGFLFDLALFFAGYLICYIFLYRRTSDAENEAFRLRHSAVELRAVIDNLRVKLREASLTPANEPPKPSEPSEILLPDGVFIRDFPDDNEIRHCIKVGLHYRAQRAGLSDKSTLQEIQDAEEKKAKKQAKKEKIDQGSESSLGSI